MVVFAVRDSDDAPSYEPTSAYIIWDITDARRPRWDVPKDRIRDEWREAIVHPGGGWSGPLEKISEKDL